MRTWWIAIGLLAATPAVAADQFDLVCTAKKSGTRYRIDLTRGEWCEGDGTVVKKVAEATTGMLFLARHEPSGVRDKTVRLWVNRNTGEWADYSYDPAFDTTGSLKKGFCQPASFSGFPSPKF